MIISVANPIYDTVFKFLLEDERIVISLISALLQSEVRSVELRKHEYTNVNRDDISLFRIDFGAQVLQSDGSYKLVLIELQKTWLESEPLRFRQYLGTQYSSEDNMVKDERGHDHGIPMVAVYLLGHRVGDIEEPVLYVRHGACDYYGKPVTKGLPDPFVESLVHDSIIVQLPLLHGRMRNRLERILSVFDQANKDERNAQRLNIDDRYIEGDVELERIVRRLGAAGANAEVRRQMNIEEEYFHELDKSVANLKESRKQIELLDIEVGQKMFQIGQMSYEIDKMGVKINEMDAKINEKDAQINEKDAQINEKDAQINEKNQALMEYAKVLKKSGLSDEDVSKMTTLPKDVVCGL